MCNQTTGPRSTKANCPNQYGRQNIQSDPLLEPPRLKQFLVRQDFYDFISRVCQTCQILHVNVQNFHLKVSSNTGARRITCKQ